MSRLDVALDVGPTTDALTITLGASSPVPLTLPHDTYWTLGELCDEIQAQAQVEVDPAVVCQETNGVVVFSAGGADLTITWTRATLRWWLGFEATDTSSAAAAHTGTVSPSVWRAAMVWGDSRPLGWEWSVRHGSGPRGRGRMVALGQLTRMAVSARVTWSELAQARSVLALMLRGLAATWWRDQGNVFDFSTSNWRGRARVRLSPETRAYADQWRQRTPLQVMELPLELVVVPS